MAASTPRYRYIDSLRALAAYAVVWLHVAEFHVSELPLVKAKGTALYDAARLMDTGRLGVVTFFIISGFVIPFSLRLPKWSGAKKFLIRRFWRLYPAYWFTVLAGYFAAHWLRDHSMPLKSVLANFTMVQEALGFTSVMGHFWTLETELIFYTICLCFFLFGLLRRSVWVALTVVGFWFLSYQLMHGRLVMQGYNFAFLFLHLGLMFWGTLFRAWDDDGRPWKSWKLPALVVTLVLLMWHPAYSLKVGLVVNNDDFIRFGLSYLLGAALFVFGTTLCKIESKFLSYLGEISYSVYLLHPVVFYIGTWLCLRPYAPEFLRSQHLSVYIAFYFVACSLVAAAVYRWIEKPAIALGQRFTRS